MRVGMVGQDGMTRVGGLLDARSASHQHAQRVPRRVSGSPRGFATSPAATAAQQARKPPQKRRRRGSGVSGGMVLVD